MALRLAPMSGILIALAAFAGTVDAFPAESACVSFTVVGPSGAGSELGCGPLDLAQSCNVDGTHCSDCAGTLTVTVLGDSGTFGTGVARCTGTIVASCKATIFGTDTLGSCSVQFSRPGLELRGCDSTSNPAATTITLVTCGAV